jgi:hypothetical protein
MYLFVHVIRILLAQYDRIAAMGEFVTLGCGREGAMVSKLRDEEEGEERRESSMSRVYSGRRFSSVMSGPVGGSCTRRRKEGGRVELGKWEWDIFL